MGAYWRAVYSNGSWFSGAYADIDRDRLVAFNVYPDDVSLGPVISVPVPEGTRLVHRTRVNPREGWAFTMVAVESEDRSQVDLRVLVPQPDGTAVVHRQDGYHGSFLWPPELIESEL